jgi:hypothetical protein
LAGALSNLERVSAEPSFDPEGMTHRLVGFSASRSKSCLMEVLPDGRPMRRYSVASGNVGQNESADVIERSQNAGATWRRFVYGYWHKSEVALARHRVHPLGEAASSQVDSDAALNRSIDTFDRVFVLSIRCRLTIVQPAIDG